MEKQVVLISLKIKIDKSSLDKTVKDIEKKTGNAIEDGTKKGTKKSERIFKRSAKKMGSFLSNTLSTSMGIALEKFRESMFDAGSDLKDMFNSITGEVSNIAGLSKGFEMSPEQAQDMKNLGLLFGMDFADVADKLKEVAAVQGEVVAGETTARAEIFRRFGVTAEDDPVDLFNQVMRQLASLDIGERVFYGEEIFGDLDERWLHLLATDFNEIADSMSKFQKLTGAELENAIRMDRQSKIADANLEVSKFRKVSSKEGVIRDIGRDVATQELQAIDLQIAKAEAMKTVKDVFKIRELVETGLSYLPQLLESIRTFGEKITQSINRLSDTWIARTIFGAGG